MQIRVPPHDVLSEKALLGSMMISKNAILEVSDVIRSEMFYDQKNAILYSSMMSINSRREPIDLVSLISELKSNNKLDDAGGISYVTSLSLDTPMSSNAEYYAKNIVDKYNLRKLITAGEEIAELGFTDGINTEVAIESATMKMLSMKSSDTKEDTEISDIISEFDTTQEQFKDKQFSTNKYLGIPCGFSKIDEAIDGLRPGHFWSIAGYTSAGKTQALLNIINNVMTDTPVSFFSLEMSKTDIIGRLIGIQSGVSIKNIMRHDFQSQEEIEKFTSARERLVNSKLKIYSKTNTLDAIILAMTRDILKNGTKLFAIDYIQLVRTKSKSEYEQITEAAQRLQTFARETGCTIIVLSQVSNEHARDPNQEVHGTKGGGSLPASVDLAIELFNEDKKEERDEKIADGKPFNVRFIIKKNRHGRCGYTNLDFTPWNGRFTEYETWGM